MFSPVELRLLRKRAGAMPLSTFLRTQGLRQRPLPADRVPAVNLRTVGELQRIGNNLNQAVHLLHTGCIPPNFGEILRRLLAEIRSFHRSLIGREP